MSRVCAPMLVPFSYFLLAMLNSDGIAEWLRPWVAEPQNCIKSGTHVGSYWSWTSHCRQKSKYDATLHMSSGHPTAFHQCHAILTIITHFNVHDNQHPTPVTDKLHKIRILFDMIFRKKHNTLFFCYTVHMIENQIPRGNLLIIVLCMGFTIHVRTVVEPVHTRICSPQHTRDRKYDRSNAHSSCCR